MVENHQSHQYKQYGDYMTNDTKKKFIIQTSTNWNLEVFGKKDMKYCANILLSGMKLKIYGENEKPEKVEKQVSIQKTIQNPNSVSVNSKGISLDNYKIPSLQQSEYFRLEELKRRKFSVY